MSPLKILAVMVLAAILIIPSFPLYVTYVYTNCVDDLTSSEVVHIEGMQKIFRSNNIGMDQAYFYLTHKALECTFENLSR